VGTSSAAWARRRLRLEPSFAQQPQKGGVLRRRRQSDALWDYNMAVPSANGDWSRASLGASCADADAARD
jgi:hypothetical protein